MSEIREQLCTCLREDKSRQSGWRGQRYGDRKDTSMKRLVQLEEAGAAWRPVVAMQEAREEVRKIKPDLGVLP